MIFSKPSARNLDYIHEDSKVNIIRNQNNHNNHKVHLTNYNFLGNKRYSDMYLNKTKNQQTILNGPVNKLLQAIKNENQEDALPKKLEFKLSHVIQGENTIKKIEDINKNIMENKAKGKDTQFYNDESINSLMYWKRQTSIGPGFNNLGNTCFLNSVLQSLMYTPALRNYFSNSNHIKDCRAKGVCFLCEFSRLVNILS
jgi:hypothetical protein